MRELVETEIALILKITTLLVFTSEPSLIKAV
jgi:hypothetical protein